jgi:hypothetical protein
MWTRLHVTLYGHFLLRHNMGLMSNSNSACFFLCTEGKHYSSVLCTTQCHWIITLVPMSLSTTKPTWAALGLNPGLCGETTARAMTRSFHILLFPYRTHTTASRLSSPPFSSSPLHLIIIVSAVNPFLAPATCNRTTNTDMYDEYIRFKCLPQQK